MLHRYLPHSITDLAVAAFLAFCTDILVSKLWGSKLWERFHHKQGKPYEADHQAYIKSTFLFGMTHSISLSARAYLGLWATEVLMDHLPFVRSFSARSLGAGHEFMNLREAAPGIAFTIWTGLTLSTIKRVILLQWVQGKRLGRVALFDHLLDFGIFLVSLLNILDQLHVDLTVGFQSILSAGGIGALIFSLASKDLAEQIVGGFSLNAWEALNVGEKVRLGDGTEGVVLEIGLVETMIRGWDNIVTRIPNAQLTSARISNLSRVSQSRLKQYLRFQYKDLDQLPDVLSDIKEEIRLSCPKLIPEKSFYAVLVSYEADHIKTLILAHFSIKPVTREFVYNRQEFLLAIARATKKHNVAFALPSMVYHGSHDGGGSNGRVAPSTGDDL